MVDANKAVYDLTDTLRSQTLSKLSTVTSVGNGPCLIGTASDFLYYMNGDSLIHLSESYGIQESHILSVVNTFDGYCFLSTTDTGYYSDVSFQHYTPAFSNDSVLYFQNVDPYYKELTEVQSNNGHRIALLESDNTVAVFDTEDSLGMLTALFADAYNDAGNPNWHIGSVNGIVFKPGYSPVFYRGLQGQVVNDIVQYHQTVFIATNHGLYYELYPDSLPQITYNFPFSAVNDLEVYGNLLLAATDNGLLYITDTSMCENLPPEFTISSDTLIFPDSTTVQFSSCGVYDSYEWNFGDGTFDSTPSAIHVYDSIGTYHVCLTTQNFCGTGTHCMDLVVLNTGVKMIDDMSGFNFFPNPFHDVTRLACQTDCASLVIRLFDMFGNMYGIYNSSQAIGKNLPPGIFFCEIVNNNGEVLFSKLIKQ